MLALPIETPGHKHDMLILILDGDNIARMRAADPAELALRDCGKHLVNPTVLLCLEEDQRALTPLLHAGDLQAIIRYLKRGWQFRPDRGDHDRGPEPLRGGG
jgi:hypothetical protein